MSVSRMTDLVGRVLSGRYRLTAPIGAGASAQVFLAEDTRLRRRVAVKLLHAGLADDEGFLRRFLAEAQAAAALNHPHILAVYDWGEDDGTPYLVTELLSGGSLRGMLDAGYRLSPSQALLVGLEATRALEHAHRRGFVHRDIKPANLLFGEDGRLRIADFGLARALAEAAWTEPAGAVMGTARYASPEQARGESVDGRADVYALGLTLIEAVTGKVPFAADTTIGTLMARIDTPVPVPDAMGPLQRALIRAGQPDPADRPDAGELGVGLMAAAEELARPEPLPLVGATPALAGALASGDATLLPGAVSAVGGPGVPGEAVDVTATSMPVTAAAPPSNPPVGVEGGAAGTVYDLASDPDDEALDVDEPPRRRRRWLRVLLIVIGLALAPVGGYLAYDLLLVPSHEVPEVVELDVETATALLEENGWDVAIVNGRDDDSVPGEVLAQDPAAAASLKEGETVTLTVSLGRELQAVPAGLANVPAAEAEAAIVAAGLTVGPRVEEHSETVSADFVIALAEGTPPSAETGTEISLVVSLGPEDRIVPTFAAGTIPADACAAIEALQLVCEQVQVFSDDVAVDGFVGTTPSAGAAAARDSIVQVEVSKGPELVAIPDVRGQSVAQATATLEGLGLTVDVFPQNADGAVIATNPSSGSSPVRRGTLVEIFASRR